MVDFYDSEEYLLEICNGYRSDTIIGTYFPSENLPVAHIMTTKELSRYLKLHEITICKYAAEGQIPAIRIGSVWRFDKDVIDAWIRMGQKETKAAGISHGKGTRGESGKKKPRK